MGQIGQAACRLIGILAALRSLHRQHVDRDAEPLLARTDDDAVNRRDVGEVAADNRVCADVETRLNLLDASFAWQSCKKVP
ncbi:MAG: hypothetical protein CFE30_12850 [Bradyrhizobium sp. PARBB1]|nr:MAG: hypothetical protein CFE30_12850 [Bradyrhizobium sp. PARBB1]